MADDEHDDVAVPDGEPAGPVEGEAVAGTVVTTTAVQPSAAQRRSDGRRRINTAVTYVTPPTAVVVIITWLARLFHLDLDPGAGSDMPADVTGAFVALGTWLMAHRANRSDLRAVDE